MRCPDCGAAVDGGRFCPSCGALVPQGDGGGEPTHGEAVDDDGGVDDGDVDGGDVPAASDDGAAGRGRWSRRDLLVGAGGVVLGGVAVGLVAASRERVVAAADVQRVDGNLPGVDRYDVGSVDDIVADVLRDGVHWLDVVEQRTAVVAWDPSLPFEGHTALDEYGPWEDDGPRVGRRDGHPVLAPDLGLLVLSTRTDLGCGVPYCTVSGWFEDPCHGTLFNGWGEWVGGPSQAAGLPRYRSEVVDGRLVVANAPGPGRPVVDNVLGDDGNGPACVTS